MAERLFKCKECAKEYILSSILDAVPICCGKRTERDYQRMRFALDMSKGTRKDIGRREAAKNAKRLGGVSGARSKRR